MGKEMKDELIKNLEWLDKQGISNIQERMRLAIEMQRNNLLDTQNDELNRLGDKLDYLASRTH